MRNSGIKRKVDNLGRITLPKEFRDFLNITTDSTLEIILTELGIYMTRSQNYCAFCGEQNDLIDYKENYLCFSCCKNIKKM